MSFFQFSTLMISVIMEIGKIVYNVVGYSKKGVILID
jgi:hypothetical protein